jgi:hypothetical protein
MELIKWNYTTNNGSLFHDIYNKKNWLNQNMRNRELGMNKQSLTVPYVVFNSEEIILSQDQNYAIYGQE